MRSLLNIFVSSHTSTTIYTRLLASVMTRFTHENCKEKISAMTCTQL